MHACKAVSSHRLNRKINGILPLILSSMTLMTKQFFPHESMGSWEASGLTDFFCKFRASKPNDRLIYAAQNCLFADFKAMNLCEVFGHAHHITRRSGFAKYNRGQFVRNIPPSFRPSVHDMIIWY